MTPLFKRLGFLLVLGLVWLAPAKANAPYVVQACTSTSNLSGGAYNGTWYCHLNSTTSGNTIVVSLAGDTTTVVPTATEALTCPGGAVQVVSIYRVYTCYVLTASSHSAFDISITTSGGTGQAAVIDVVGRANQTLRRLTTLRPRCGYGPRACWAWRQRLSC